MLLLLTRGLFLAHRLWQTHHSTEARATTVQLAPGLNAQTEPLAGFAFMADTRQLTILMRKLSASCTIMNENQIYLKVTKSGEIKER